MTPLNEEVFTIYRLLLNSLQVSSTGEVIKRYGLFRYHGEEDQEIIDQLDKKRNGLFRYLNKREYGTNIEVKTDHEDVNQELEKSNGWIKNIEREDETKLEQNTGVDVNRMLMKISADDTDVEEKSDTNVNQDLVKKNEWYNNNGRQDDSSIEDKIAADVDEKNL